MRRTTFLGLAAVALWFPLLAQAPPKPTPEPKLEAVPAADGAAQANRTNLNLQGQTNTAGGEGRRNENVQFNAVDTNAARELNKRVGVTATLFEEFGSANGYYGAEFGNAPRTAIHTTAQGGAGTHGTLLYNHNNSIFSARSFFQAGPVKPARINQFNATMGTGLWRGAFFTLNAADEINRGSVNGNVLIPLQAERIPLATDPAIRAAVQRLMDSFPNVAPNGSDSSSHALNANAPQQIDTRSAAGQITQKLRPRETLAARYAFTSQRVLAFQLIRATNPNTWNRSHTARISWNRALDARTVVDASLGFERQNTKLQPANDATTTLAVSGFSLAGPNPTIPLDRAQNRYRYSVSISQQRGKHTLVAGLTGTRTELNGYEDEAYNGVLFFRGDFGRDAITNFRLGTPSQYTRAVGTTYRAFRNNEWQAYAGDRWNVNPRLTLNYGVHYEPITRPEDKTGRSHLLFGSDLNNVAPSAGFAWRAPHGVTVRGAYAIEFGQIFPATFGMDRFDPPYSYRITVQAPPLINPLAGFDLTRLGPGIPSNTYKVSPELATPYSQQYNLILEREIAKGWKLQAGYLASRSVKLFQSYILNRARPVAGVPFTTATINQRRPDQSKLEEASLNNAGRGYYDAARVTLTVPRWHRVNLNASYWFSKAIDLGTDYNATGAALDARRAPSQTEFDSHHDMKALSAFDQPHALLVQANYDLPRARAGWMALLTRDWSMTAVGLLKNGTPFTVESGSDGPGFGNVDGGLADRVVLLDASILGRTIGNPDTSRQLLPYSAFRFMDAPRELAGNLGRNTFRRGKIANVNASVARNWKLPHDRQLNLRGEAINLFNTPQFAEPGVATSQPNFGQINNTLNDGRTFRFQLRLSL